MFIIWVISDNNESVSEEIEVYAVATLFLLPPKRERYKKASVLGGS